jgi:hypothetical protein
LATTTATMVMIAIWKKAGHLRFISFSSGRSSDPQVARGGVYRLVVTL